MFNVHVQFNVLCTVYCGRGCVSLESENFAGNNGQRTTGISGFLRGPRGPKKWNFQKYSPGHSLVVMVGVIFELVMEVVFENEVDEEMDG